MTPAILAALNAARAAHRAIVAVTDLATGATELLRPDDPHFTENDPIGREVRRAAREDRSGAIEIEGRRLFLNVFNPPLRLIIVGAVHIAQPLAIMARLTGYHVSVIDPRGAFATAERFPNVELTTEWPDVAMETLHPDQRSAVVLLTHDPKLDDPALKIALQSKAFYIGALGSKKTQAARRARMAEAGFDEHTLSRIHGPVGLDINAKTPAEIAIAILAEMTVVLRGGSA